MNVTAQQLDIRNTAPSTGVWTRIRTNAPAVLGIALQLVLVALILGQADMFTSGFRRVFYLACAGFVVHHFLPAKHRLTFFTALCGAALLVVLGGTPDRFWDPWLAVSRAVPLVACGAALAGICLLPIGFWKRVLLLVAAGAVIAALRADLFGPDALLVVWPLLAAFVMFRLMIFLYDVSTSKARPDLRHVLSYLFLLPNAACTLFPLVDFKTLIRSHYDSDALDIYRRGMGWIIRGVLQLLAYRLIRELASLDPASVSNGRELIQFILASTFVYLQVSGTFHLVVGMLLLFGFNLPETNRRYFLASSFTDYWRRVNIYWKDFILKIFYYPTYFRLKSLGPTRALVVATLWSFFMTWLLHLYQTWWLKGSASLRWTDVLFWSILALLVLANSLWEMKHGRQRKLASSTWSVRSAAGLMLRTGGTFVCISLLWSLWSTPELSTWIAMWRHFDASTVLWWAVAVAAIMAATVVYEILPTARRPAARAQQADEGGSSWSLPALLRPGSFAPRTCALLLPLLFINPSFQSVLLQERAWQPWIDALNTGDSLQDRLVTRNRGYYEQLTNFDNANARLWEMLTRERWDSHHYQGPTPVRTVQDFRFREPLPNVDMEAYDTHYRTNSWGMRDDEYTLEKPAGVLRIAVLGSSHTMGWGIAQHETFASLLEEQLNAGIPGWPDAPAFEVLNFAMNGYSPLSQIDLLDVLVARFSPDIVLLVTHPVDYIWVGRDLPRALRAGVPVKEPYLQRVLYDARISARTHELIAEQRIRPHRSDLLAWAYRRIVQRCREMGALPVALLVPLPKDLVRAVPVDDEQARLIEQAGFVLFDQSRLYEGLTMEDTRRNELDEHMNERAHRMVADALYRSFVEHLRPQAMTQQAAVRDSTP